jgi:hypothetical protein
MQWTREVGAKQFASPLLCARLALVLHHRGFWAEAQDCLQTGWDSIVGAGLRARPNNQTLQAEISHYLSSLALDMGDLTNSSLPHTDYANRNA